MRSRTFGLSLLVLAVTFGLTVLANEKPTMEFQALMKSNAATSGATGLRAHITAKDYDAIAKDAATLKANFDKIEDFFTKQKVDDAVKFAKAARDASEELEKAANAKDDTAIAAAQMKITPNCAGCHTAHREQLPDKTYEIK